MEWRGRGVFGFFSVFYSISHIPSLAATPQPLTVVAGRTDTALTEKLHVPIMVLMVISMFTSLQLNTECPPQRWSLLRSILFKMKFRSNLWRQSLLVSAPTRASNLFCWRKL